ncbi:MAG: hypothetical protein LQ350_008156 [Teloschistes chrysophthalmus]|nr:MAG: hypothetical protein LQ350_008156 [Niorma chrysophthalma]
MAWVRPKKKPAPKKVVDPEARRNTLHYFSCGHQPQKRNSDRLKSSDLVILEPRRQRNPMAYADENDPLVKDMLASQGQPGQSKVHNARGRTRDDFDVVVVDEEEDSVEQGSQRLPQRAQRRVITAPPREYAHSRPTYVATGEHRPPGYHALFDDPQGHSHFERILNAAVSPSGDVLLFSGIFLDANTDDKVAAVLGHEIAHVLARHKGAQLSAEVFGALVILPIWPFILGSPICPPLAFIALPFVFALTSMLGHHSRKRESEADEIGMLLMTEAGFDPVAAVSFWTKMAELEKDLPGAEGEGIRPEYQSTHPHPASRIETANDLVPDIFYITGKAPLADAADKYRIKKLEDRDPEAILSVHFTLAGFT